MATEQETFTQPTMTEDERTALYQLVLFTKQYERITKDATAASNSVSGRIRSLAEPYLLRDHPNLTADQRLKICGKAFKDVLETYRQRRKDLAKAAGLKTTDVSSLALADEIHASLAYGDEEGCLDGIRDAAKWPEQLPTALRDDFLITFGASLAMILSLQSDKTRVEDRVRQEIRKLGWYDQYLIEFGITGIKGLSDHYLGVLIGYIRDPSNYPNIDCIYQRMGVGVTHRDDGTDTPQGKDEYGHRLGGQDAIDDGYCPTRRTVLFHLSSNIVRQRSGDEEPNKYLKFHDDYGARDKAAHPEEVDTGRKRKGGSPIIRYTPRHMQFRRLRVTGKEVLKDLMISWWRFYGRVDKNPQTSARYKEKAA